MKTLKEYNDEIEAIKKRILKETNENVYKLNKDLSAMKAEALKNPEQFINDFFIYMSLEGERIIRDKFYEPDENDDISSDDERRMANTIHTKDFKDFAERSNYVKLSFGGLAKKYNIYSLIEYYATTPLHIFYKEDIREILKLKKESITAREYEARKAQLQQTTSKLPPI